MRSQGSRRWSRRNLIGGALAGVGLTALAPLVAACQPQVVEKPVEVTKVVERERIVERPVEVTKVVQVEKERIVERVVTPTAAPKPAAKGPVTIRWRTYSGNADPGKSLAPKIVARFREKYSYVTVTHEAYGVPDWMRLFITDVAAGTPPDVIQEATEYFDKQAVTGALLKLDDYLKAEKYDIEGFHPAALPMCRSRKDNGIYALPEGLPPSVLFYNVDLFEQAKVDPPPEDWSWTFDDLLAKAKALTKRDARGVATQWGYYLWRTALPFTLYDIITAFGGKAVDENWTKTLIGEGGARDAMKWVFDLYAIHKAGATPEDVTGIGANPFSVGKAAMFSAYLNQTETFLQYPKLRFGIAPLPKGPAGQFSNLRPYYTSVAQLTKFPEEATRFLMFFASKDGLETWAPVIYTSRDEVNKSTWELLPPKWLSRPKAAQIGKKLGYAAVYGPGHGDWWNAMGAEMEKAWAGKQSFDEALVAAVKAGDKVIEENNRLAGLSK